MSVLEGQSTASTSTSTHSTFPNSLFGVNNYQCLHAQQQQNSSSATLRDNNGGQPQPQQPQQPQQHRRLMSSSSIAILIVFFLLLRSSAGPFLNPNVSLLIKEVFVFLHLLFAVFKY